MQALLDSMDELKKSSAQIGKIIKVIDDIAFQTNILASNAAIEAARAGEAGMGFAVVAEEVRNLAQRSAQAAKETAGIIESNINLSDKGMAVTETVKISLADITGQAKKMSELIEEIAAASQEQYLGIEQVNQAISQIENITEHNSATAQENASAAEELNAQAQSIMDNVQPLSLLITGHGSKGGFAGYPFRLHQKIHPQAAANPVLHHHAQVHLPDGRDTKKEVTPEDVIPLEKDAF